MGYKGKDGGGAFMNNGKGMCSYGSNPMKKAKQVEPMCGPGGNKDQQKANKLIKKAHAENDSLRGMSGM